ncbi:MAG: DUF3619 family protein [Desulfovibrionales bacterium]
MKDPFNEDRFVSKVREHLDTSACRLDPAIASRLASSRHRAVHSIPADRFTLPWKTIVPALSTAMALMLIVLGVLTFKGTHTDIPAVDDAGMLMTTEIDLLEDLEFYSWLAEEGHVEG